MIGGKFAEVFFFVLAEILVEVKFWGGGRNVDDQNVDRPKISERRNGLFSWSERRKANYHNVEKQIITTSKRVDHYYKNYNVEKNVKSHNLSKNHFRRSDHSQRHR